jgi:hypothetical protein
MNGIYFNGIIELHTSFAISKCKDCAEYNTSVAIWSHHTGCVLCEEPSYWVSVYDSISLLDPSC